MRDHEIEAVRELCLDAYLGDYSWIDETYAADIADVESRAENHQVWVCEERETGQLLGTVTTGNPGESITGLAAEGEFDLRLLAVRQSARKRGIGEYLMTSTVALARSRGANAVLLNTGPEMRGAIALYERLGFTRLSERDEEVFRSDGSSFTLLTYRLPLD
nr:GNAT family N-acetyltransferase [Leucobacter chinensis]